MGLIFINVYKPKLNGYIPLKAIKHYKMKAIALLVLSFVFFSGLGTSQTGTTTLAVLDFENRSFMNAEAYASLSQGLAEMMITELSGIESVKMVERRRLKDMLSELNLAQSGLVSESNSIQVGKMLGARNLVFGSFMVMPGEKIRIDIRIVEVETGSVVKAEEQTGKTKQVLTLIKKLGQKLLDNLDVRLTKAESKMLNQSRNLDMKAVMLFSEGLGYEDRNNLQEAYLKYKQALAIEPEFLQVRDAIQRIAEKKRNQQ